MLSNEGFGFAESPDGPAYANFGAATYELRQKPDGAWSIDPEPFARYRGEGIPNIAFAEPGGIVWLSISPNRLVRLDMSAAPRVMPTFAALVRRVTVNQDRVLFAGTGTLAAPELQPASNALRMEFSAPSFLSEATTEFQSRLDGLDSDWSPWNSETRRDYTNLGFGTYTFRVRARNVAGQMSDEAVYAFTILPPWYRTWWAYGGYLLVRRIARLRRRSDPAPPSDQQGA